MAGELLWDFVVPTVLDETNYEAQRAIADFLKMAEKRFAEINKNDNERVVNSTIT